MPRKCTLCRSVFPTEVALDTHIQSAHSSAFKCPSKGCNKSFHSRTLREEHYATHLPPTALGQVDFAQQQRAAPIHQSFKASDSPVQYQANQSRSGVHTNCSMRKGSPATSSPLRNSPAFSSSPKMSANGSSSPIVDSETDKGFDCAMCGATFLERLALNQHNASHMGEFSNKCKRCDQVFATADALEQHNQQQADCSRSRKQWLQCANCEQLCDGPGGLQYHNALVHKPKPPKTYAITVHLPPRIHQQMQKVKKSPQTQQQTRQQKAPKLQEDKAPQMKQTMPTRSAQLFTGGGDLQAQLELQKSTPFNATLQSASVQTKPANAAPHLRYPVHSLLATRPVAVLPLAPSISQAVRRTNVTAPFKHTVPKRTHHAPPGVIMQGYSTAPSKSFERSTQQPKEISSRVTNFQLPDRPKYNVTGEVLYNEQVWTGIAFDHHDELLGALYWRCHLSMADRRIQRIPSAFDEALSSDGDEDVFEYSPAPAEGILKHRAVGIACHKVTVEGGKQEIALLSVLDFFTGEVLLHHFVLPNGTVENWRTRITGFKENTISDAIGADYAVLNGWKAARQAMWLLIDANSILIGCGLRETLDALRMTHGCAVDGAILVQEAAGGSLSKKDLRLENLSQDLLGHELKSSSENGRDCLENAFAARELVIWSTKNKDRLATWGKAKIAGGEKEADLVKRVREELATGTRTDQDMEGNGFGSILAGGDG